MKKSVAEKITGWLALYTKARQEQRALVNIERQGFTAYCPMIRRLRRHARRIEHVRRPLFPSYVFVHLDKYKFQWRPLLSTTGVSSVVQFDGKPALVPEGFIESLQACENESDLRAKTAPRIEIGETVRILDGSFDNLVAKVLSLPEKDRIWLLLDIMGRKVRVQHDVLSITRI